MSPPKASKEVPPPVPSRDNAAESYRGMDARKRRGYNSTILGGRTADAGAEKAMKTLLGS